MSTTENNTDTRTENLAALAKIFQDYAGVDAEDVTVEADISDDLGVNSLALVEITIRTEDAFGVRLDDRTVGGFSKVGHLLDYLEGHGGKLSEKAR